MNKLKSQYTVLGIMSGTSLDGLDLCLVNFYGKNFRHYKIINTRTIPYPSKWKQRLAAAEKLSGRALAELDVKYGELLGKYAADFIHESGQSVDLISSHGHTVFHEPQLNYSKQIGHGAYIAAKSNHSTVADLRSSDLAYGGQGAPLVPFGDDYLFSNYKACLNLGGIANISIKTTDKTIAFDIAAANMVLNHICETKLNIPYDPEGQYAAKGKINHKLIEKLNQYEYYTINAPKSLGKEDIDQNILPIIENSKLTAVDLLCSYSHHLSHKIIEAANAYQLNEEKILVSGGGAYNENLINLLEGKLKIYLPNKTIIEFKEAVIFAFLGLRRFLGKQNIYSSVTGAKKGSIAGALFEA